MDSVESHNLEDSDSTSVECEIISNSNNNTNNVSFEKSSRKDSENIKSSLGENISIVPARSENISSIVSKTGASLEFYGINSVAKDKVILKDINGYCPAGHLLALMGPSGAGKSSLLNTLCKRTIMLGNAKVTGSIYINQSPIKPSDNHRIGYVMQDDIFFASLTLRETMRFYGRVRLPDSMSNEEKKDRIMEVLDILEIKKNLDTLIGGGLIRGLSGGERKRANIAVELIPNPDILVLDEPTSGLDSGMALSLIKTLKNLALTTNKTFIASIHQPNSQIFYSFDYLLLLSYGEMHYFGLIKNLVSFYDSLELYCYENWNMADYIIDMARESPEIRQKIVEGCKKQKLYLTENLYRKKVDHNSNDETEIHDITESFDYTNGMGTQIKALVRRNFVRSLNEYITFLDLLDAILLGVILGIVYWQKKFSDANYTDVIAMMFFPPVTAFLQPLFINVFAFTAERHVIIRERSSKMYRLVSYYFAKTISELPIVLIRPLIFFTIFYFMSGLNYSVYYLASILIVFLVGICGQSIGVLFSSFGLQQRETMVLVTLYMVICLQTGGVFNRTIPVWLSWIRYISPVFHGYIVLFNLQFLGFKGIECTSNTNSLFMACLNGENRAPFNEVMILESLQIPVYAMAIIFILIVLIARFASLYFLSKSLKRAPLTTGIEFKFFVRKTKLEKPV